MLDRDEPRYSREELIDRGFRAKRLLDDDLFREATEGAEWDTIRDWANTGDNSAHYKLQGIQAVIDYLNTMVGDAQVAEGR